MYYPNLLAKIRLILDDELVPEGKVRRIKQTIKEAEQND